MSSPEDNIDEFAFIAEFLRPLGNGFAGGLSLLDDVAVVGDDLPQNGQYVISTDTIVDGVHVLREFGANAFAWRGLGCAVSDIVAKGAVPYCYFMNLSLPDTIDRKWLEDFSQALQTAQETYGLCLAGGDCTTSSQIVMSFTIVGVVENGTMIPRNGAQKSDGLFITGTIGDGLLGLKALQGDKAVNMLDHDDREYVKARYLRPTLRNNMCAILHEFASASMDVSDGLLQDCDKLARASGLFSELNLDEMPLSHAAMRYYADDAENLLSLANGGDDYEILFTAAMKQWQLIQSRASDLQIPITHIGFVRNAQRHSVYYKGVEIFPSKKGYVHFS